MAKQKTAARADSAVLFIRVTPHLRRQLAAKARRDGRTLTDWVRRNLAAIAGVSL